MIKKYQILMSVLIMAFFIGEVRTGLTKQCHYESMGNIHIITIKGYSVCPVTIDV